MARPSASMTATGQPSSSCSVAAISAVPPPASTMRVKRWWMSRNWSSRRRCARAGRRARPRSRRPAPSLQETSRSGSRGDQPCRQHGWGSREDESSRTATPATWARSEASDEAPPDPLPRPSGLVEVVTISLFAPTAKLLGGWCRRGSSTETRSHHPRPHELGAAEGQRLHHCLDVERSPHGHHSCPICAPAVRARERLPR